VLEPKIKQWSIETHRADAGQRGGCEDQDFAGITRLAKKGVFFLRRPEVDLKSWNFGTPMGVEPILLSESGRRASRGRRFSKGNENCLGRLKSCTLLKKRVRVGAEKRRTRSGQSKGKIRNPRLCHTKGGFARIKDRGTKKSLAFTKKGGNWRH